MEITKANIINYGGDILAFITAIVAIIAFIQPYVPDEYAGTLGVIALMLTRGSTLIAKIIESIENEKPLKSMDVIDTEEGV